MEYPSFKLLSQDLLTTVADQARTSPRLRQNYDFHTSSERVQRFINVLQPGTYVRPHRHCRPAEVNGFEFFLAIQGELGVLLLNQQGEIIHHERIGDHCHNRGIELAEGTFHTLVALTPDSTVLELKEGPYDRQTDKEFLTGFPLEGTPDAAMQVQQWQGLF